MKTELIGMSLTELEDFLEAMGEKRFRGRQVYRWIYRNRVRSFAEMTDLPRGIREELAKTACLTLPCILQERISEDGTRKLLLQLKDRKTIEMVIIPHQVTGGTRYTACISSQVGCPVRCRFCATGASGFERNLEVYEIVGQALLGLQWGISNVVFMGMGEPLLNYQAVLRTVGLLIDHQGINIGQRHITISTAGEARGIRWLAGEGLQVTLAVSLHSARDELRDVLVPLNRKYPLAVLREALNFYQGKTRRRVTLEYVLLDKVNTGWEDAQALIQFTRGLLVNVNLIPYNEVEFGEYRCPQREVIDRFKMWLTRAGVNVTLREEKGADIEAACGQLKTKKVNGGQQENTRQR